MNVVRTALMFGVAAAYAAAILQHEQPGAMAVGLAPLVWLTLEGCWRLFDRGD